MYRPRLPLEKLQSSQIIEMNHQIKESGTVTFIVKPKHEWDKMMSAIRENGIRTATNLKAQGQAFDAEILAPRKIHDAVSVPLSGVMLDLDWKITTKLEMVEHARDIITKAFMMESLDPALPTILSAIIEGRGLYEYGIGEFFLLYGKFEQKHHTSGRKTLAKMKQLTKGNSHFMKPYKERGKETMVPLPYAVRNILSHVGTNPNTLDPEGKDLRNSIKLLRSWVKKK